eukprot:12892328-Prorocentrum_lima.AAC.1
MSRRPAHRAPFSHSEEGDLEQASRKPNHSCKCAARGEELAPHLLNSLGPKGAKPKAHLDERL